MITFVMLDVEKDHMGPQNPHMNWVLGYSKRYEGRIADTHVAEYYLRDLMNRQYINRAEGETFLEQAGLIDFHWSITWPEDFDTPDEMLVDRLADVGGYAIFIHGWVGNLNIWEDLPGLVVSANRQLVALSVDHNGFGESPFLDATPSLESCNPPAAMRTLQNWIDLIKIRRQPGMIRQKVINLIGHSMGGATLFYLNPLQWSYGEVTRTALAPALLLEDESHRAFYTTLGLGIGILQRLPVFEFVSRFLTPSVINVLAAEASDEVKNLHREQYQATARGVTGATLMAMGRLRDDMIAREYKLMRVMLGHRDPLVGLVDMIDLLSKHEFPAANIHVVPGTHYMFSVGHENTVNALNHSQARDIVVNDIVKLHGEALAMQKTGYLVG